ncbi:aminotransferase class III-fold pyridoxal phosphate-dependent enzyme [Kangiella taiwanensis]|uniref:Aminotransferase class III-fold pyridoxal phosphate-dependent enzyme n=1 Tax=Kangiella taiwanensis TaxID=1079179 RepID=A0ABP8HS66_9GAMM|nr:aminotransferase class III-fold pyridoxal phosphate-dependent enzyme [Kangiella taiwanensis]
MTVQHNYNDFCKPKLNKLLSALKLDKNYIKAEGNYLFTDDGKEVIDFVGGFGVSILGHNHPTLINEMKAALDNRVAINSQCSVRSESANLAQLLNEYIDNGQNYKVNFSNSGAESVEAAIKHAYKVHFDKVRREYERITRILNDFYYKVEREGIDVELPGDENDLIDFRNDLDEYNLNQFESFQKSPVIAGLKGSYHGKTCSPLKVTFNKSYREGFEGLSSIQSAFVDHDKPERLKELVNEMACVFYYPVLVGGKVEIHTLKITRVMAFIMETLQGEGGIKPVPEETLSQLASIHDELKIPFIIDEIQTGCGRLGSIYSYQNTALNAIAPEYITLSKSLGGGLVKIGATLIRGDIYDQDFGILHTSTFAEDDLSARVAIKALELLKENDSELLKRVNVQGGKLLSSLETLQKRYPEIIKNVRGKGLMIGVELTPLRSRSPFFRATGKQGVLSMLVASYLLEYHNIRLLAPLTTMLKGNPGKNRMSILRVQPPATITDEEIDALLTAFTEVLDIIQSNNEYLLVAHLIEQKLSPEQRQTPVTMEVKWPFNEEQSHIDARTGFIVHPTKVQHLIDYFFPSFERYEWSESAMKGWWNNIARFLEPVHVKRNYITSRDFILENNLVFVPYLPEYLVQEKEAYLEQEVRDKVQDAVTIAKELGDDNIPVSIIGLGAYSSIVTNNGITVNDYESPITTGNAYTAALTLQGMMFAANNVQPPIDITQAEVSVVGAAGNIGSVLSQILALQVGRLCLVGSGSSTSELRLKYARKTCLAEIIKAIKTELNAGVTFEHTQLAGVGKRVYELILSSGESQQLKFFNDVQEQADIDYLSKQLDLILTQYHSDEYEQLFLIRADFSQLKSSDIVVVATNSPDDELIKTDMVRPGAVVCCASVPSNLSQSFEKETNKYLAFDGGLSALPEQSEIKFVGMPENGLAYGCLAETLILGFEGQNHSFCKGPLSSEHVYQVMSMAEEHGFELGNLKLNNNVLLTTKDSTTVNA